MQASSDDTLAGPVDPWEASPAVPLTRAQLKVLLRRSDGPGLRYLFGHVALALVTASLVFLALGNPILLVLAMFAHGVVLVFLFAPMHECTHGTAFRRRWLNAAVGSACGFILLRPSRYFKWRHAAHHTYTQDPARDPDLVPMPANLLGYVGDVLGARFWPKLIGSLYRSATGRFSAEEQAWIPESERSKVSNEARVMIALYVALIAISIALGSLAILWYWIIPRTLAEPALRLIRMVEHTGMDEGPDPLTNTRTTKPNPLVQFLYWNMPYHLEHHLAPSVPFHALACMHEQLPDSPAPPSILQVHRGLVKSVRASRG
jgi:fatty acid desaturase